MGSKTKGLRGGVASARVPGGEVRLLRAGARVVLLEARVRARTARVLAEAPAARLLVAGIG